MVTQAAVPPTRVKSVVARCSARLKKRLGSRAPARFGAALTARHSHRRNAMRPSRQDHSFLDPTLSLRPNCSAPFFLSFFSRLTITGACFLIKPSLHSTGIYVELPVTPILCAVDAYSVFFPSAMRNNQVTLKYQIAFVSVLLVLASGKSVGQERAEWQLTETKLSTITGEIQGWSVSRDLKRTGYVVKVGNKSRAVVDGVDQLEFDKVNGLQFSPDSKRTAFLGTNGNETSIVVDGKVEPSDPSKGKPITIAFTPDSKRIYYKSDSGWVIDGKLYNYAWDPVFSQDGSRFALCGENRVNIDGQERSINGVVVGSQVVFSPDSKHVAFQTIRTEGLFIDLNGKESPSVGGIQSIGYPHKTAKGTTLWEVLRWARPVIAFSPDSQRLAYWGYVEKNKLVMVVDGKAGTAHRGIGAPVFSADSRHLAYVAWDGNATFLVIDGEEKAISKYVVPWNVELSLSSDGKRTAYFAELARNVVVDAALIEGYKYDTITPPVFSPSGQHVAYFAGTYPGLRLKWQLFINGSPFGGFLDVAGRVQFIGDDQFEYSQFKQVDKKTAEIVRIVATKKATR